METWSIVGQFAIAFVAGLVSGAVALVMGGAGSLRVLAARLETLESRQDELTDKVKRQDSLKASRAGVEARAGRQSDAEIAKEAAAVLAAERSQGAPMIAAGRKRPSVITGG